MKKCTWNDRSNLRCPWTSVNAHSSSGSNCERGHMAGNALSFTSVSSNAAETSHVDNLCTEATFICAQWMHTTLESFQMNSCAPGSSCGNLNRNVNAAPAQRCAMTLFEHELRKNTDNKSSAESPRTQNRSRNLRKTIFLYSFKSGEQCKSVWFSLKDPFHVEISSEA